MSDQSSHEASAIIDPLHEWQKYPKNQDYGVFDVQTVDDLTNLFNDHGHIHLNPDYLATRVMSIEYGTEIKMDVKNFSTRLLIKELEDFMKTPLPQKADGTTVILGGGLRASNRLQASLDMDWDTLRKMLTRYSIPPVFVGFLLEAYTYQDLYTTDSVRLGRDGKLSGEQKEVNLYYTIPIPFKTLQQNVIEAGAIADFLSIKIYTRHSSDFSSYLTMYGPVPQTFAEDIVHYQDQASKIAANLCELWIVQTLLVLQRCLNHWYDAIIRASVTVQTISYFTGSHIASATIDVKNSSERIVDCSSKILQMQHHLQQVKDLIDMLATKTYKLLHEHNTSREEAKSGGESPHIKVFVEEKYEQLKHRAFGCQERLKLLQSRLKISREMIFNTVGIQSGNAQSQNLSTMRRLGEESSRANEEMRELARLTRVDSHTMKVIAFATLVYLPSTFVATLYSTDLVKPSGSSSNAAWTQTLWFYAIVCIGLTLVMFLSWELYYRRWKQMESQNHPSFAQQTAGGPSVDNSIRPEENRQENTESRKTASTVQASLASGEPKMNPITKLAQLSKEAKEIAELWTTDPAEATRRKAGNEEERKIFLKDLERLLKKEN